MSVPPFEYQSVWWWILRQNEHETRDNIDLIGPSAEPQFQKQSFANGSAHLLNIFADEEEAWTERERVEFCVKTYVYLSKLQRSGSFDRFIVADCDGAEPLITGILSTLAPIWVQTPQKLRSSRGEDAYALIDHAQRQFTLNDWTEPIEDWPPASDQAKSVWNGICSEG